MMLAVMDDARTITRCPGMAWLVTDTACRGREYGFNREGFRGRTPQANRGNARGNESCAGAGRDCLRGRWRRGNGDHLRKSDRGRRFARLIHGGLEGVGPSAGRMESPLPAPALALGTKARKPPVVCDQLTYGPPPSREVSGLSFIRFAPASGTRPDGLF